MLDRIMMRCEQEADYILTHNATVREVAKKFGVSKSTVHKDMTEWLRKFNGERADQVQEVLKRNKSVWHIRGGEATRKKYNSMKL